MSWGKAIFKEVSENIPTKAPTKTPSIASIGRLLGHVLVTCCFQLIDPFSYKAKTVIILAK